MAKAFLNTFRLIKKQSVNMYKGIRAGDPVAIVKGAAGTGIGVFILSILARGLSYDLIEEYYQKYIQFGEDDEDDSTSSSGGGGGSIIP